MGHNLLTVSPAEPGASAAQRRRKERRDVEHELLTLGFIGALLAALALWSRLAVG